MLATLFFSPFLIFIFLMIFSELRPKLLLAVALPAYLYNLITVTCLLISSCVWEYTGKFIYVYQFFNWSTFEGVDISFTIWLDYVAVIMTFTVLVVATMVNLFSMYYMANDPFIARFFAYLSLFTFCMLLLVIAADLVQFFIGWELVGLCSYLLINFWYSRKQANISALKAVLVNRIGDFCFMYAMALIYVKFNTLNIQELAWLVLVDTDEVFSTKVIAVLLFIAVMSKSAQFGLHSWLPDAMEGPTPVSALIHAATMVTAGIFLMLRLSNLFIAQEGLMELISLIGAFTAFFGATTGSVQTDIKKIIAFSTCSQLGYMVAACGLGNFAIAFFHLVTHAFFKSLLFLCAGIVIHTMQGDQDIRKMGYLLKTLPTAFACMTIASLALAGMPYLSGFYSKELIISLAYTISTFDNTSIGAVAIIVFVLLIKAAIFTSFYSAKLLYHVFLKGGTMPDEIKKGIHAEGGEVWLTQVPLAILAIFSIFGGLFFKEMLVNPGHNLTLSPFSEFLTNGVLSGLVEYLPWPVKAVLTSIGFSGFIFYGALSINKERATKFVLFLKYLTFQLLENYTGTPVCVLESAYDEFYAKVKPELEDFLSNRWYFDELVSYFGNKVAMLDNDDLSITFVQNKIVDGSTISIIFRTIQDFKNSSDEHKQNTYNYVKNTYIAIMLLIAVVALTNDTLDISIINF